MQRGIEHVHAWTLTRQASSGFGLPSRAGAEPLAVLERGERGEVRGEVRGFLPSGGGPGGRGGRCLQDLSPGPLPRRAKAGAGPGPGPDPAMAVEETQEAPGAQGAQGQGGPGHAAPQEEPRCSSLRCCPLRFAFAEELEAEEGAFSQDCVAGPCIGCPACAGF